MAHPQRDLEPGIRTDLDGRLTYGEYLRLDQVLSAQHPLSEPQHHDEMLFIIQHQTSELWLKLMIHELDSALARLRADDLGGTQKVLARVKQIQRQLYEQWGVLETLTPAEYLQFRDVLGPSSGFQSLQYRIVEFLLGNKHADMLRVFEHDPADHARLRAVFEAPGLYDEYLRFLARKGHPVPVEVLNRDFTQPWHTQPALLPIFKRVYEDTATYWSEYHLSELLVDIEENFQLWRFRHMKTVERIIGFRPGTGGSSGVAFLRKALEQSFFPELIEVRTILGT
ncbi:tryptophan 2,3-dioxygenase [Luteibacter aegosomatissinici]|uniref:tryptophan 2,3-dioxygenase n=1 Tax=Luteibacter aegosomatissinici TaxID=2911539 RepID=UPI001FFBB994|nr:tryptophan 2,3-dioxygenase family protein [Luteibacter aegosomatissinici]UPG95310.1 tryptophan 2,3-dioxygenase family protein [Luteibacter aegosomatissinici]